MAADGRREPGSHAVVLAFERPFRRFGGRFSVLAVVLGHRLSRGRGAGTTSVKPCVEPDREPPWPMHGAWSASKIEH